MIPRTSARALQSVNVVWPFSGFGGVQNPPYGASLVTAGRYVEIHFGLGGDRGLNVVTTSVQLADYTECSHFVPVDGLEQAVEGLTYSGSYTFTWKTDASWGGCRRLVFSFADGTTRSLLFQF